MGVLAISSDGVALRLHSTLLVRRQLWPYTLHARYDCSNKYLTPADLTLSKALLTGECDMALAGGGNVITSPSLHQNLAAASFLNPSGSSCAFDASAAGYCRGEGAGIVVLKPLSKAIAAGDNILSVISGSAVNQGSSCGSITVPDSHQQSALYIQALSLGSIDPTDVSYVEAHGTGG